MRFVISLVGLISLFSIVPDSAAALTLWKSNFSQGLATFGTDVSIWGRDNLTVLQENDQYFLRVYIPENTYDPASMRRLFRPLGGAGFKLKTCAANESAASLSYRVRFDPSMDFVLGGKLPGLYGGQGNSGGSRADGTNGFSFRYMWGKEGQGGSIYAYLPGNSDWGLPMFGGKLKFKKGVWQDLRQELILNKSGVSDGILRVWLDGVLVGEATNLMVRTTTKLGVAGLFFDVFFGGGSQEWASKSDVYIDFKDFVLQCW